MSLALHPLCLIIKDSLEYEDIKTVKALFAHLKQHLFLKGKTYLFLDEIQEVKSWEKVVNSLEIHLKICMIGIYSPAATH